MRLPRPLSPLIRTGDMIAAVPTTDAILLVNGIDVKDHHMDLALAALAAVFGVDLLDLLAELEWEIGETLIFGDEVAA